MDRDLLTWTQVTPPSGRIDVPASTFDWCFWERLIRERGVTIDRPRSTAHPRHPSIIYPIDYGFLPGTRGGDEDEVDVWSGSGEGGLVAIMMTIDHVKKDREVDLLWNCTAREIYLVNGFVNFDQALLEGRLMLRETMAARWRMDEASASGDRISSPGGPFRPPPAP